MESRFACVICGSTTKEATYVGGKVVCKDHPGALDHYKTLTEEETIMALSQDVEVVNNLRRKYDT